MLSNTLYKLQILKINLNLVEFNGDQSSVIHLFILQKKIFTNCLVYITYCLIWLTKFSKNFRFIAFETKDFLVLQKYSIEGMNLGRPHFKFLVKSMS